MYSGIVLDGKAVNRLTFYRVEHGWSQKTLAQHLGVAETTVYRWEHGRTQPQPRLRKHLCALFNVTDVQLGWSSSGGASYHATTFAHRPPLRLPGREEELAVLLRQVAAGTPGIAVHGLPGVGKTALAEALAHTPLLQKQLPDGVLWATLGPQPALTRQAARWGVQLGLSQRLTDETPIQRTKVLKQALADRHLLVVLDDVWTLEDALALRVGGPGCLYLVTTRFPRLAARLALGGQPMRLAPLSPTYSRQLLRHLAPQAGSVGEQTLDELLPLLGGLPLALTIVGRYLHRQSYQAPARRMAAALERVRDRSVRMHLQEPDVSDEQTSRSLSESIALSVQGVHEAARVALSSLGVLPLSSEGFSEAVALAVAACSGETLDHLSDAGLLECIADDRYQLHPVIPDYARLHLSDQQYAQAIDRLTAFSSHATSL